jgi:TonB-dependent SusC/RagA subfamily outer membrane receptor
MKKTVTVTAGGTTTVDFELTQLVVRLQDVVSTATGQQRKIELGHTVANLGDVSSRVEQTSITNMSDLLVAKVAGMVVIPGAFTNGSPRSAFADSIRCRSTTLRSSSSTACRMNTGGSSSNGGNLASSVSVINDIDPSTIEDIEIVKGPSAATLYGTDAANGVVVITTKKGRAGKTRWAINAEQGGIWDKSNYPTAYMIWGHAPGSTTAARCYTYTISAGTCVADSTTSLNLMTDKTGLSPLGTGFRNQWNLQASGGTDAVRYFVSGGLENETSPLRMPDFSRQRLDSTAGGVRPEWLRPEYYQKLNANTNLTLSLSPSVDLDVSAALPRSIRGCRSRTTTPSVPPTSR